MPFLLIGLVLGGGGVWYATEAGDKLVRVALVAGAGYLAWKYLK